jgi:hypothetical protein
MFHGSKDFTDFALNVDGNQVSTLNIPITDLFLMFVVFMFQKELLFTKPEYDSDADSFDSSQTDRYQNANSL